MIRQPDDWFLCFSLLSLSPCLSLFLIQLYIYSLVSIHLAVYGCLGYPPLMNSSICYFLIFAFLRSYISTSETSAYHFAIRTRREKRVSFSAVSNCQTIEIFNLSFFFSSFSSSIILSARQSLCLYICFLRSFFCHFLLPFDVTFGTRRNRREK